MRQQYNFLICIRWLGYHVKTISPLAPLLFGAFPLHRAICRKQTTQNEARARKELTLPATEPRPGLEKRVGREPECSQDPRARGMSSVQPSPSFLSSPPDLQIPHWFKLSLPKACKLVRTSKREEKNRNGVLAHRAALPHTLGWLHCILREAALGKKGKENKNRLGCC